MIFYHGTSKDNWKKIKEEGVLFGRRYIADNNGNLIKEVDRCTYLTPFIEEAQQYGDIILQVKYNPFNKRGNIKKGKNRLPTNNYVEGCWQMRVYEPIPIEDVTLI